MYWAGTSRSLYIVLDAGPVSVCTDNMQNFPECRFLYAGPPQYRRSIPQTWQSLEKPQGKTHAQVLKNSY